MTAAARDAKLAEPDQLVKLEKSLMRSLLPPSNDIAVDIVRRYWPTEAPAPVASAAPPASAAPFKYEDEDTRGVDKFAVAMKAKLADKRAEGKYGWDDPDVCDVADLERMLHEHYAKGDIVDIANFCMMLHQRGSPPNWRLTPPGPDAYWNKPAPVASAAPTAEPIDALPPPMAIHGTGTTTAHHVGVEWLNGEPPAAAPPATDTEYK